MSSITDIKTASNVEDLKDYHEVPTNDTTDNSLMRDVIGNKNDKSLSAPSNGSLFTPVKLEMRFFGANVLLQETQTK